MPNFVLPRPVRRAVFRPGSPCSRRREAAAHQGPGAPEVPSPAPGHGRQGAAGGVAGATADGGAVAAGGASIPQRGTGGSGRSRRRHRGAGRPSGFASRRVRLGRAVAHRQSRRRLDSPLRLGIDSHDRRLRDRRCRRPHPLRRNGRGQLQPHLVRRDRRVQVRRRRPDLAQRGPLRYASHRPPLDRSGQPGRRAGRRGRASLHRELRAGRLPHGRRREDLVADALRRRPHQRDRSGPRPDTSRRRLRRHVGARAHRGELPRKRAGLRSLEVDRRREDLEEARRRASPGRDRGPHRPGGLGLASIHRLCRRGQPGAAPLQRAGRRGGAAGRAHPAPAEEADRRRAFAGSATRRSPDSSAAPSFQSP